MSKNSLAWPVGVIFCTAYDFEMREMHFAISVKELSECIQKHCNEFIMGKEGYFFCHECQTGFEIEDTDAAYCHWPVPGIGDGEVEED